MTTHLTILLIYNYQAPGFMTITPSFSPFSLVFSNHMFSNCSFTVDVGFVKLSSDCFCGNRVFKMNIGSAVTFAVVVLWFLDFKHNRFRCTAISFTEFWFSATIPLS